MASRTNRSLILVVLLSGMTALTACSSVSAPRQAPPTQALPTQARQAAAVPVAPVPAGTAGTGRREPLPAPAALPPFPGTPALAGEGAWQAAGRLVGGSPAVFETQLVPPGGTKRAGIAWMDPNLLSARLYSGSLSPGGGPYQYTAPVSPGAADSLVAAFNGGFKMADAHGGYYTEHRMVRPLVRGAASLVFYADGSVTVGAWGSDVTMTPYVVAVRQNLFPLVVSEKPTARATTRTWRVWGGTCPCGRGQHGTEQQWRSGIGVTADGALVYVAGPALTPVQVADLLVRAGTVRGMELDINPTWPVFASYRPASPAGAAGPANGSRLVGSHLGPATFFDPGYARDFVTMSARR